MVRTFIIDRIASARIWWVAVSNGVSTLRVSPTADEGISHYNKLSGIIECVSQALPLSMVQITGGLMCDAPVRHLRRIIFRFLPLVQHGSRAAPYDHFRIYILSQSVNSHCRTSASGSKCRLLELPHSPAARRNCFYWRWLRHMVEKYAPPPPGIAAVIQVLASAGMARRHRSFGTSSRNEMITPFFSFLRAVLTPAIARSNSDARIFNLPDVCTMNGITNQFRAQLDLPVRCHHLL